jgi:hypothetical protein
VRRWSAWLVFPSSQSPAEPNFADSSCKLPRLPIYLTVSCGFVSSD